MSADAWIIDGYVDEPACLGVPPYISPYIRTVAGVLVEHGYEPGYHTIDQLRQDPSLLTPLRDARIAVMIAGVTVPGKYLGGTPATLTEISQVGVSLLGGPLTVIGGPIAFGYSSGGGRKARTAAISGFDHLLAGSPAEALDNLLCSGEPEGNAEYRKSDPWSLLGSPVIRLHPSFPHIICELETARGCPRSLAGGCAFCTEQFYGAPQYRDERAVSAEAGALHSQGGRHFRVGRQPDILVYKARGGEFPRPEPERIDALFAGIRHAAPGLVTLHIDNVNPGTIARHPEAAAEGLRAIIRHHTPGDVAAFGMETADPAVIEANNLKASQDQVLEAIRIVNRVGRIRNNGIPELLPGINFVCGLAGETPGTYRMNRRFLETVRDEGLLLRRINIRQLMPFAGTPAFTRNTLGFHDSEFRQFKEWVRKAIDLPMLRNVFPVGTVLRNVVIEKPGEISFGRQLGSYPILTGIPLPCPAGKVIDAVIVDHGMRSVTGLPVPVRINRLPARALRWLPGVGKKRSASIAARRPFRSLEEFRALAGPTPIDHYLSFS
jgi:radical SAM superfamily enzyme with C-terminal helix-hairpin-helix motif